MNKNTQHVCVLSTGKIIDFQIAEDTFKTEGLPFFRQQRNDSGLILAMPLAPVMGPGIFFEILVPIEYLEQAREIIHGLPISQTTEPDFWHFNPKANQKPLWKAGAIFLLCIGAIILILSFVVQ